MERNNFSFKLLLTVIFLYFIFFELILPPIIYFPKPSLLLESLVSLFTDYHLLASLTYTIGLFAVLFYLSLFLINLSLPLMIHLFNNYGKLFRVNSIVNFYVVSIILILTAFFFPDNIIAEILFLFVIFIGYLKLFAQEEVENIPEEYLLSVRSLAGTGNPKGSKIFDKFIAGKLSLRMVEKLNYFWGLIILYEFISHSGGVGKELHSLLNFKDISALWALIILLSLIIFFVNFVIKFADGKIYFWRGNES